MRNLIYSAFRLGLIGFAIIIAGDQMLSAQTLSLTGPLKVRTGSTHEIRLEFTALQAAPVSALQWEGQPVVVSWGNAPATKEIQCSQGSARCVLYGRDNATPLTGLLAKYQWTAPAAPGTVSMSLSNVVGAAPNGTTAQVTTGPNLSIQVLAQGDVNGDGRIDATDTFVSASMVIGLAACTPLGDLNDDGRCDVTDTQRVANLVAGS